MLAASNNDSIFESLCTLNTIIVMVKKQSGPAWLQVDPLEASVLCLQEKILSITGMPLLGYHC